MTDLEVLVRNINVLTELLRVARDQLANPFLRPFERREADNQIGLLTVELRRQLQLMEAERGHPLKQLMENGLQNLDKPKSWLFRDT